MKILLLSAYDAQSHRYWRTGLVEQFPEHDWTTLTLPARHFSWRLRGNSLTWAYSEREVLERHYDLVVATSMTDLSALKGLVPNLARIPSVVYFHENQFAYPESGKAFQSVEPKMLNIYTALAADRVVFNSDYNRTTFLAGCRYLLKKLPDHVPDGLPELIEHKTSVIPVPLINDAFHQQGQKEKPLNIVWNHRWEYDKGPNELLRAIRRLGEKTKAFKLHVVGQQFRQAPEHFERLREEFSAQIGAWGYVESEEKYRAILRRSDVVLSTALHDFQGISVLEAVASGCLPLVPKRLAYPELFDEKYCYEQTGDEAQNLADKLDRYVQLKAQGKMPVAPDVSHLNWTALEGRYRRLLERDFSS